AAAAAVEGHRQRDRGFKGPWRRRRRPAADGTPRLGSLRLTANTPRWRAAIVSRAGGDPAHVPLADLVPHQIDAVVAGYEPGAIGTALGQLPSRGRQPLVVLGEHRLQRLLRCLVTARASAVIRDSARLGGLRASAQADGSQAGEDHRVGAYAHASMLRRPGPDPGLRPVAKPERPGNSLTGDLAGLDARGAHVHALGRTADR